MSATPQPWFDLRKRLKDVEEQLRKLRNTSPFSGTGMSVPADGVTQVDGSLVVQGGEAKSGNYVPATSGWHLGSDGTAEFKDITLYDLPNSMLATPVVPGVVNLYTSNFSLPFPGYAEITGVDIVVPARCTILAFTGTGSLDCYNAKTTGGNNGTGGDYIYPQVRVGGNVSPGNWATGVSGSNGNATASRTFSTLLTGLTPGSTVRASVYGSSDYGISADPGNLASLSATLSWFR